MSREYFMPVRYLVKYIFLPVMTIRGEHPDFADEEDNVKPLALVIGGKWGQGLNKSRLGTEGEGYRLT